MYPAQIRLGKRYMFIYNSPWAFSPFPDKTPFSAQLIPYLLIVLGVRQPQSVYTTAQEEFNGCRGPWPVFHSGRGRRRRGTPNRPARLGRRTAAVAAYLPPRFPCSVPKFLPEKLSSAQPPILWEHSEGRGAWSPFSSFSIEPEPSAGRCPSAQFDTHG